MDILGMCFDATVTGVTTRHDLPLVAVAYVAAAIASYAALDTTERLRGAAGPARPFWHLCAALVLGGGVWSMHFIAMLAYRTPLEIGYDPGLTILSGLVAVAGVALGLHTLGDGSPRRILGSGVLVGLSIVVMHYVGMGAMRLPGEIYYRPALFGLSVFIAVAAAGAALWLAVNLSTALQRAAAALVMAVAICGMHFTGMAATVLVPAPLIDDAYASGLVSSQLLATSIVASLALILLFSLTCAWFDRRLEAQSVSEAGRLRALNETLEAKVEARTADLTGALLALDEQRRRAEQANRSKSDFLANMSHELRTPLNAVIGFAQILQMRRGDETLSPAQGEAVEQIGRSGGHLLALIEEVLDFAKIESGSLDVSLEALDPHAVAHDLLGTFRLQAERAGVALSGPGRDGPGRDGPEGDGPDADGAVALRADPLKFKQVLANLISNAIKYNRPGGSVRVEIDVITPTEGANGKGVRPGLVAIAVRDTGLGLPADRLASLFEPFNRLGRETLAVEGAGLGLALTKRLVEAMDGVLEVQSVEGEGSAFIVRLPAAAAAELATADLAPATSMTLETPRAVALYIEDNASNIRLMQHVFEALGSMELHVADHPVAGLEAAAQLRPDVILLDINLPDMDGFEVKARLDADPATQDIPVIALSANVLTETLTRGRVAGFHDYLTKPLNIEALVEAIRDALQPAATRDGDAHPMTKAG